MDNKIIDLSQMPANTRIVFEQLAEQSFISKYTLVGGTALSIQIIPDSYRDCLSENLDFIYDGDKLNQ